MASLQLPGSPTGAAAGTTLKRPQFRVSVRKAWAEPWEPLRYLQPLQAASCAAPLKSSAVFRWLVGRIKWEDVNAFRNWGPVDLRDAFVRIELLPQPSGGSGSNPRAGPSELWVGRFVDEDVRQDGSDAGATGPAASATAPRGEQVLTALGLEEELDRVPVRGSWVTNDGQAAVRVDTPVVFNEQYEGASGLGDVGNRSLTEVPHPDDETRLGFVFAGPRGVDEGGNPQSTATVWSVRDIVRHLLAFHAPPEFGFTLSGQADALDGIVPPRLDLSGLTVFGALNRLIDRRRGLGWCVRLTPDGKAAVHVYSVLDAPVSFDDATVEANAEQYYLRLDDLGHLTDECGLQLDTYGRYGKIVVSGERVLSCFTVAANETLFPGWTTEEQAAYATASAAGSGADAATLNDQARADLALDHVFSHFHVGKGGGAPPPAGGVANAAAPFDWKVAGANANPLVDPAGRVTPGDSKQPPVRGWGHRVERFLPFRAAKEVADADPEYERPFATVLGSSRRRVMTHLAGGGPEAPLIPLDHHFGVAIPFTPRHRLARGRWPQNATPTKVHPDEGDGSYDWTSLQVTVAVRTDERLEVAVELVTDGPLKDRVLHLPVPDAELHYVVPGTVRRIKHDGTAEKTTDADAVARDDSERLRKVAALATAWYGRDRAAMRLTVRDLWVQYRVGALVQSVSDRLRSRAVNTVVSQVIWDLAAATTTVRTNYSELDVTAGRRGRRGWA